MLTLHHAPTSVCSQKVRVGMALMGLSYDRRVLNLQAGEQFAPTYRTLNPDAVVPTLEDAGLVVVESSLILDYLDREYNGGRLMLRDRTGRVAAHAPPGSAAPMRAAGSEYLPAMRLNREDI
jgi:glutathione S-transferase